MIEGGNGFDPAGSRAGYQDVPGGQLEALAKGSQEKGSEFRELKDKVAADIGLAEHPDGRSGNAEGAADSFDAGREQGEDFVTVGLGEKAAALD